MKKNILLLILLVVGLLPAKADNITVDGTNRSYNVYVPKNLGENRPLFIFCHGYNQDANWMQNNEFKNDKVSMEAVCDTAKFIIVFPNGIDRAWDTSGNRDINFIKALIDKMATQYKIDRNRVYLGGFSMGGMLTYHAMNKIPDLIAAFVPVSGYPMGGATANANVRPIPIMHIHGTGDDVCAFSGAQPALNVWIKHNGCPTTAKVVSNYNGFNAKMHTWAPGKDDVEVKLLELANKGHWICKETQVYTGKEMWNFCKKYSLNKTNPSVSITSPKAPLTYTCFAPVDQAEFPSIDITADASDPNGTIAKVEFYDGNTLIATCEKKPYKATFENKKSGTHTIKVVATDNDGETGSATIELTYNHPLAQYSLSQFFSEAGSLPSGWATDDGNDQRTGYSNGYNQGCRVFQFTASRRGFNYGLYFRNVEGKANAGTAKYGLAKTNTTLTLQPGKYALKYKVCNWNRPSFSPIDIYIEKRSNGQVIASQTYTPTVNIGNDPSNSFGTVAQQTLDFEVTEAGDYVLAFRTAQAEWADGVIGQLTLMVSEFTSTGIEAVHAPVNSHLSAVNYYNLQGQEVTTPTRGIYIHRGKKVYVKNR
jgi:poly(3-hydroxybutyrate) depolymerase